MGFDQEGQLHRQLVKFLNIYQLVKKRRYFYIKKNNYVLTPGRFVGAENGADDDVSFQDKFDKLKNKLQEHFEKNRELEEKIKERLDQI